MSCDPPFRYPLWFCPLFVAIIHINVRPVDVAIQTRGACHYLQCFSIIPGAQGHVIIFGISFRDGELAQ
jgi:hypothetical protein